MPYRSWLLLALLAILNPTSEAGIFYRSKTVDVTINNYSHSGPPAKGPLTLTALRSCAASVLTVGAVYGASLMWFKGGLLFPLLNLAVNGEYAPAGLVAFFLLAASEIIEGASVSFSFGPQTLFFSSASRDAMLRLLKLVLQPHSSPRDGEGVPQDVMAIRLNVGNMPDARFLAVYSVDVKTVPAGLNPDEWILPHPAPTWADILSLDFPRLRLRHQKYGIGY